MSARELLQQLAARQVLPRGLSIDSRRVGVGDVFLAWPGAVSDGRNYIAQAIAAGASAVLYEAEGAPVDATQWPVPVLPVQGLAQLAGALADQVYGQPSAHLRLLGVTGTNGKTSISQWLAQALGVLEGPCAVIGTMGNGFVGALENTRNTTPDAITLHRSLAAWQAAGAKACAMEVSSIGLAQGRVNGARFHTAIFTNLTRDHLEDHGTMEAYGAAKALLFRWPELQCAVINLDDPFGRALAAECRGRVKVIGYALAPLAPDDLSALCDQLLVARNIRNTGSGTAFELDDGHLNLPLTVRTVGRFNVANLLAVCGALLSCGHSLVTVARVLAALNPPAGRMELIVAERGPLAVVDYAHTPDALENVLKTLRETATARAGRLWCVFGCGGNRDPGKRPLMGAIARRWADEVLVTSDNPRNEDPQTIIAAIVAGISNAAEIQADLPRAVWHVEADRAQAIRQALTRAEAKDVVLIAGKGHETYQEVAGERHHFSDVEVARSILEMHS